ncbi:MAG: bifunctional riboflavin kinase/FAD synthetase [Pseudomonadota bacterium]
MELIRGKNNLRSRHRPTAVTIGNFDGVHRGHQAILRQLRELADANDLLATVMAFEPMPREFFAPDSAPARLSRLREKLQALRDHGADQFFCLPFNAQVAGMAPETFVGELLVNGLGARHVIVGDDFRFGAKRSGDYAMLKRLGDEAGFSVTPMATVEVDGERVSSTAVRAALAAGNMDKACRLLGRRYSMTGHVTYGNALGRTLGFPTANIRPGRHVTPLSGIFAVWAHGIGDEALPAVASVGTRPTVAGSDALLEVHVFDFSGDLYGRLLRVEFVEYLRPEEKFPDLETMRVQMLDDAASARRILAARPAKL